MPRHVERRVLQQTPEQLFTLVGDVERYPEFLPWCRAARIMKRSGNVIHADLVVGSGPFRETFTSCVTLDEGEAGNPERPPRIDVEYVEGPMHHMENHWIFRAVPQGTEIDFMVEFEFRSSLLESMMGSFFSEAVNRMVGAFETRANEVYGTSGA